MYVTAPSDKIPDGAADLLDTSTFGTIKILGLGRPEANLYSYAYAGIDASQVTGMTISDRTITLVMDTQTTCQRMLLYKMLPYKQMRRIWICNDAGIYWIDGYATELPYDEMGHEVSSFEIPVFCPYPWFRGEYHEVQIVPGADEPLNLAHMGDAPAGIFIYAQGSFSSLGSITGFRIENSEDFFEASTHFVSGSIGPVSRILLVDTTPGIGLGTTGRFDAEYLASIDMSSNLLTVEADTGTNISLSVNGLSVNSCQFFAGWYDTYTAI